MPRVTLAVAMGVGAAGALVDVSSYVRFDSSPVTRDYGQPDEFTDTQPSEFSFVLENFDGRFTPDNTSSPLTTKVTEGMRVVLQVGTRLTEGTIRKIEPSFPNDDSAWAMVMITCDDLLGTASRLVNSDSFQYDIIKSATALVYWPLDDPIGTQIAPDQSGNGGVPITVVYPTGLTFQTAAPWGVGVGLKSTAGTFALSADNTGTYATLPRWFSFWVKVNAVATTDIQLYFENFLVQILNGSLMFFDTSNSAALTAGGAVIEGQSLFISVDTTTSTLWVDGVSQGSLTQVGRVNDLNLMFFLQSSGPVDIVTGQIAYTATRPDVASIATARTSGTFSDWLRVLTAAYPALTFDNPTPSLYDPAPMFLSESKGTAVLNNINTLVKSEAGYLSTVTTGTLTSPSTQIKIRERTRPSTVSATFNIVDQLSGAPSFVRDLTNLVSTVNVSGPTVTVSATDTTLTTRAGGATQDEQVYLLKSSDLFSWGQDRLQRGANTRLRIVAVTIDAMTTPTDISSTLFGLALGDRVQFTGLPSTQLGFSTWDGWLIGGSESHTVDANEFTFVFQPVLPTTAIFDTDRFTSDGYQTLTSTITSSATTASITSTIPTYSNLVTASVLSKTEVPYNLLIDSEIVTVTAVNVTTSPQTVTITRGVSGTTAAAHTAGAVINLTPTSLFAF